MRPLAVAITLLTVAAQPAATQDRYRVAWWDAASVLVAGGLSVIPQAAGLPRGAPPCAPCDPASLPGIDHAALHTFSASAGTASSVLLAGVVAGRERLPHRTRNAVVLYAASLGVAALRVSAGHHFPTDVAGGAALGVGIGWLAARVHPTGH